MVLKLSKIFYCVLTTHFRLELYLGNYSQHFFPQAPSRCKIYTYIKIVHYLKTLANKSPLIEYPLIEEIEENLIEPTAKNYFC